MAVMRPLAGLTALSMLTTMVILVHGLVMTSGAVQVKPESG